MLTLFFKNGVIILGEKCYTLSLVCSVVVQFPLKYYIKWNRYRTVSLFTKHIYLCTDYTDERTKFLFRIMLLV